MILLLNQGKKILLNTLMRQLEERYKNYDLDFISGIDARGFIFGSILADRLDIVFLPVRKKGKLPYTTIAEKYNLEYDFDEVEIHIDAFASTEFEGGRHSGRMAKIECCSLRT